MNGVRAMKRSLLVLFLMGLAVDSFAVAPPALVNYQGVLRNALNAPQSGNFDMQFVFYDDADPDCGDGLLLLADSHMAAGTGDVTVTWGLFNVALGSGLSLLTSRATSLRCSRTTPRCTWRCASRAEEGFSKSSARGSAWSLQGTLSTPPVWTASIRRTSSIRPPPPRP